MTVARIAVCLMPILDCRFRESIAMVKVALRLRASQISQIPNRRVPATLLACSDKCY